MHSTSNCVEPDLGTVPTRSVYTLAYCRSRHARLALRCTSIDCLPGVDHVYNGWLRDAAKVGTALIRNEWVSGAMDFHDRYWVLDRAASGITRTSTHCDSSDSV